MSNYDKEFLKEVEIIITKKRTETMVLPNEYKENDDKFKCPKCNRTLTTFKDKKLEGNLFCFNNDCDNSWFISASEFKEKI